VATRRRSAGSGWGRLKRAASITISAVSGASLSVDAAPVIHFPDVTIEGHAALLCQEHQFPHADGQKPDLVSLVLQCPLNGRRQLVDGKLSANPDVGIQQEFQRTASQSLSSLTGETISPQIFAVPAMDPIQLLGLGGVEGGTTSATGCPKRVINTGFLVRRTLSRTARQVALNSEIAILSIEALLHQGSIVNGHGQNRESSSSARPGLASETATT